MRENSSCKLFPIINTIKLYLGKAKHRPFFSRMWRWGRTYRRS